MDLIKQLIANKKEDISIQNLISEMIDEIIKYQRLSKSPKFSSILETPLLQKQMPQIWKAFNIETINMSVFRHVISIVQELNLEPLQITIDYHNRYTDKDRKRLEIVGNTSGLKIYYHELLEYPLSSTEDKIVLTNKLSDTLSRIAIITFTKNKINIYQGQLNITEDKVVQSLKPYSLTIENDTINIVTYSLQGNNNYNFGIINDTIHVSMPTPTTCKYNDLVLELTKDEIAMITYNIENIEKFATILLTKWRTHENRS